MARYNGTSLALAEEAAAQDCFLEVEGYLSSEDGYWLSHDIWMKDSETLKEYKTRVVDALNEKGLDAKYDEVDIVTGGSDAGGSTFFNECG